MESYWSRTTGIVSETAFSSGMTLQIREKENVFFLLAVGENGAYWRITHEDVNLGARDFLASAQPGSDTCA